MQAHTQGMRHGRRPVTTHTAKQHMQNAPAFTPQPQHASRESVRSLYHPMRSAHGARCHVMPHSTPQFRPAMPSAAAAISIPARRVQTLHHMHMPQSRSMSWSAWRQHSRPSKHSHVRSWHGYAVATYTPKLPGWVRNRLPEMPEGKHLLSLASQQMLTADTLFGCSKMSPFAFAWTCDMSSDVARAADFP